MEFDGEGKGVVEGRVLEGREVLLVMEGGMKMLGRNGGEMCGMKKGLE